VVEVGDAAQVEAREIDYFSPAFTYHAFGKEELIEGFDGLRLEVLFNAYDLSAMLNVSYNHQAAR
jgi:histone acetyltransferase 1